MRVKIILATLLFCAIAMPAYARDTAFVCKLVPVKNPGTLKKDAAGVASVAAAAFLTKSKKTNFIVCENNKVKCYVFGIYAAMSCVKK